MAKSSDTETDSAGTAECSPTNNMTLNGDEMIVEQLPAPSTIAELDQAITSKPMRFLILICTLIENLIFSGIVFGWPALFYILKSEHIYEHLCETRLIDNGTGNGNGTTITDCSAQENVLNNAYTIGIFAMGFTSFAWGFALDSLGLRVIRFALNTLISVGCALLALTSANNSYLIIPAVILLGLIGVPLRIANMQIADFFPRKRSTVITIFSGAFSSSPVIFVICKHVYDHYSIDYSIVMWTLFGLSLMMAPITVFLLPKQSVRAREAKLWSRWNQYRHALDLDDLDDERQLPKSRISRKPRTIKKETLIALLNDRQTQYDMNQNHILDLNGNMNNGKTKLNENLIDTKSGETKRTILGMFKSMDDEIPLSVSLCSLSFLAHQLWFSWLNTYMVLYSGSLVLWLARVTDNKNDIRAYTQAFGLVQVTGLFFAPIAGYIMDASVSKAFGEEDHHRRRLCQARSGFIPITITTLTLSLATVCRFYNTPTAVYISLIFITLLRSFLIAVASAYIRVRFPASHFSRLNGIMCTTGAFFSLLQSPLFYFESQSNEMAFYVNLFCALMTLISWANPVLLMSDKLQMIMLHKEDDHADRLRRHKMAKSYLN